MYHILQGHNSLSPWSKNPGLLGQQESSRRGPSRRCCNLLRGIGRKSCGSGTRSSTRRRQDSSRGRTFVEFLLFCCLLKWCRFYLNLVLIVNWGDDNEISLFEDKSTAGKEQQGARWRPGIDAVQEFGNAPAELSELYSVWSPTPEKNAHCEVFALFPSKVVPI